MPTLAHIRDFLAQPRFAFIGVARQPKDFSRFLFREFRKRGYAPIPVHPVSEEIEGIACARSLRDIDPPVDTVLLMTPPEVTGRLLRECAAAGIKRVWLYRAAGRGSVSPDAVTFCEGNSISVIAGECPFMFFPGTGLLHRAHGLVKQITGAYPR